MRANDWLNKASKRLEAAGIATSRLDAMVLLEDAVDTDRAYILADSDIQIDDKTLVMLEDQLKRRINHEPLAYIRGKSEFYGREFYVTPATLQPRPETETTIDILKSITSIEQTVAVDIGTGSGAIAITAKLELPHLIVHGTEIQRDALLIAQKNKQSLNADVHLHKGNLLQPLKDTELHVILANLPYVPDSHTINQAAMQEPTIAIFGGDDGLDVYRQMFDQLGLREQRPKYLITESLPFQHESLASLARAQGYLQIRSQDFIQLFEQA